MRPAFLGSKEVSSQKNVRLTGGSHFFRVWINFETLALYFLLTSWRSVPLLLWPRPIAVSGLVGLGVDFSCGFHGGLHGFSGKSRPCPKAQTRSPRRRRGNRNKSRQRRILKGYRKKTEKKKIDHGPVGRVFSKQTSVAIVIVFWLKWAGYLAVAGLNLLAQISDRISPGSVLNCVHHKYRSMSV